MIHSNTSTAHDNTKSARIKEEKKENRNICHLKCEMAYISINFFAFMASTWGEGGNPIRDSFDRLDGLSIYSSLMLFFAERGRDIAAA